MDINAIRSSGPPLGIPRSEPIRTITPPADVKAGHVAAELEIRNQSAEISSDLRQIWDELGLLSPTSFQREIESKISADYTEDLMVNIQQGNEAGDLRNPSSPNVFGKHAYEDYMRKSRVEVEIDVAPKSRVKFDVRVHPPEIDVRPRSIAGVHS